MVPSARDNRSRSTISFFFLHLTAAVARGHRVFFEIGVLIVRFEKNQYHILRVWNASINSIILYLIETFNFNHIYYSSYQHMSYLLFFLLAFVIFITRMFSILIDKKNLKVCFEQGIKLY